MNDFAIGYEKKILEEVESTPEEYLPALLGMIRLFRQSVALKPASQSFQQGWAEAMKGETLPIEDLWVELVEDE